MPLKGNYDNSKLKLYFFDTGLFVTMLDEKAQEDLRANKNLNVYKGALYENIVGEAFGKSGYSFFYYKRDDFSLEEDFFDQNLRIVIACRSKSSSCNSQIPKNVDNK